MPNLLCGARAGRFVAVYTAGYENSRPSHATIPLENRSLPLCTLGEKSARELLYRQRGEGQADPETHDHDPMHRAIIL